MNLRATAGLSGQYLGVLLVPILIALAVGVGFALGGRLSRFEHLRINRWGLAIAAVALQFLPGVAIGRVPTTVVGPVMLATSYTLLLLFLLWNRWIPGTWLMAIGLLLNLLVVMANGGMPVQPEAIERAGGTAATLQVTETTKHHVMTEQDVLWQLGDVLAVPPPVSVVLSVGDVLLYGAICYSIVQIMRGRLRENPRPLALWFPRYRGKHAPEYWRMPVRYRSPGPSAAGPSGIER
jgi:Family of unknown function (DUF5317)